MLDSQLAIRGNIHDINIILNLKRIYIFTYVHEKKNYYIIIFLQLFHKEHALVFLLLHVFIFFIKDSKKTEKLLYFYVNR